MARIIIANFHPTNPASAISTREAQMIVGFLRSGHGTDITISHHGRCPWDNPRARRTQARVLVDQITEQMVSAVRAGQ